jgi:hypothetical protein
MFKNILFQLQEILVNKYKFITNYYEDDDNNNLRFL